MDRLKACFQTSHEARRSHLNCTQEEERANCKATSPQTLKPDSNVDFLQQRFIGWEEMRYVLELPYLTNFSLGQVSKHIISMWVICHSDHSISFLFPRDSCHITMQNSFSPTLVFSSIVFSSLNIDQNSKVHSQFWELRLNPTCDCVNNSKKKKKNLKHNCILPTMTRIYIPLLK